MFVDLKNFRALWIVPAIFPALILAGCSTAQYKSQSISRSPKPVGYPIPIYTLEMKAPRPGEVIGTVFIRAGKFTMFGGSADTELAKVLRLAREKGADAVKITDIEKPDFANPNYRMTAELLHYTDAWEKIAISLQKFQTYLETNQKNLDPIEGVWFSGGPSGLVPHTIGIIKDNSKSGRNFIAFILSSKNPAWSGGMKKMDIRRGLEPGGYILAYYLDDFSRREIPIILGQNRKFALNIQTDEEQNIIIYAKN